MKKIIGFFAIIAMAVAVFSATKNVDQSANVDLVGLTSMNTANAECISNFWNQGRCSFSGNCWYNGDNPGTGDCDWTLN